MTTWLLRRSGNAYLVILQIQSVGLTKAAFVEYGSPVHASPKSSPPPDSDKVIASRWVSRTQTGTPHRW